MMNEALGKILQNKLVARDILRMDLEVGWESYVPGQFAMIEAPGFFLRRPFGIADLKDGVATFFYKIAGSGTLALSNLQVQNRIHALGPLGNGFDLNPPDIMVAGGYGLAPFYGWLRRLSKNNPKLKLYYGAARRDAIFALDEISGFADVEVSTDDGSLGKKGLVTDLLAAVPNKAKRIAACGPMPMLKSLHAWSKKNGAALHVSVESRMGCGWGVCLGCAVAKVGGGYLRACKDGPVFNSADIDWEKI